MLEAFTYVIGLAQPEGQHREITTTSFLEPAASAANYAATMLDHHYLY